MVARRIQCQWNCYKTRWRLIWDMIKDPWASGTIFSLEHSVIFSAPQVPIFFIFPAPETRFIFIFSAPQARFFVSYQSWLSVSITTNRESVAGLKSSELLTYLLVWHVQRVMTYLLISGRCQKPCCFTHCFEPSKGAFSFQVFLFPFNTIDIGPVFNSRFID